MFVFYPILFFVLLSSPILKNENQETVKAQLFQDWTSLQNFIQQHPQIHCFLPAQDKAADQGKLKFPHDLPQGEDKIGQKEFVEAMGEILLKMTSDIRAIQSKEVLSESEKQEFKNFIDKYFIEDIPIHRELKTTFIAILDEEGLDSIHHIAHEMFFATIDISRNLKKHYKEHRQVYLQKQLVVQSVYGADTLEVVRMDFFQYTPSNFFSRFFNKLEENRYKETIEKCIEYNKKSKEYNKKSKEYNERSEELLNQMKEQRKLLKEEREQLQRERKDLEEDRKKLQEEREQFEEERKKWKKTPK